MKRYTVLLLYPDYLTDSAPETYQAWVEADTVEAAISAGQQQAFDEEKSEGFEKFWGPQDFRALAVYEGHLEDLRSF